MVVFISAKPLFLRKSANWAICATAVLSACGNAALDGEIVRPGGPGAAPEYGPLLRAEQDIAIRPPTGKRAALSAVDDDATPASDDENANDHYRDHKRLTISATMQQRCRKVWPAIAQASQNVGVDPMLMLAIAWVESGFNASAQSPAGAIGLMQLLPRTSQALGCDEPSDVRCASTAAARYVQNLLRKFDGEVVYALCAYQAGHVRPLQAFRDGKMAANVHYAERILEAKSRLELYGCDGHD